jgi:hypothetical protein
MKAAQSPQRLLVLPNAVEGHCQLKGDGRPAFQNASDLIQAFNALGGFCGGCSAGRTAIRSQAAPEAVVALS